MTTSKRPQKKPIQESQLIHADQFDEQHILALASEMNSTYPSKWLGLEIDHRKLFDAGQDGWLHPGPMGFVLGRESFVADPDRVFKPNVIPIRVVFDEGKFPQFGNQEECRIKIDEVSCTEDDTPSAIRWLAPLPLYAITKLEVRSPEEKSRIRAMIGQFSNVSLPAADFEIRKPTENSTSPPQPDVALKVPVELPSVLDAIQGAMAMAIWGVPHINPWINVLQYALSLNSEKASIALTQLNAQWLRFPWFEEKSRTCESENAHLWNAAITVLCSPNARGKSSFRLAELVAKHTRKSAKVEEWLHQTIRMVEAEESIDQETIEAGLAIQLALLRPDPIDFRTWTQKLTSLSPATLWSAAILCGWRHGYRALNKVFRGGATLREFLTIQALAASWKGDRADLLPSKQCDEINQHNEDGCFSLCWGNRPILRKRWNSRAKWYVADLTNETIARSAKDIVRRLGWQCLRQRLSLKEGLVPVSGEGHLSIDARDSLVVHQTVDLLVPANATMEEEFDSNAFKRELAIKPGQLPDPPLQIQEKEDDIPGLIYKPSFLSEEEELALVTHIDKEEWDSTLKRRVQQYGWRYDYRHRQLDTSMYLGALPKWTSHLVARLVDQGFMEERPDQLIVNEYVDDQSIAAHTDHSENFAEQIVTISLLETWDMVFRPLKSKNRIEKSLEHGSIAVFTGEVRYNWTHEIPKRKYAYIGFERKRIPRNRRISLTFRKTQLPILGLLS